MMANDFGLDYERIRQGVTQHYPGRPTCPPPVLPPAPAC